MRTRNIVVVLVLILAALPVIYMFDAIRMPGQSYKGELPPMTEADRDLAVRLQVHVDHLASTIGERNYLHPAKLKQSADYIAERFSALGYKASRQKFVFLSQEFENISCELKGKSKPDEIIIFGAHYDSVTACPGANDNGSGVAATIELARILKDAPIEKSVRFVAFPNEEHFFRTEGMGSFHYARSCRENNDNIIAMFSLETIGCYSNQKGSQEYPPGIAMLYPDTGNFIAFVGNYENRDLVKNCVGNFRRLVQFPSEGIAAPSVVPGIDWSDHQQFWAFNYPALMVTDTAPYRYKHYHLPTDTADKMNFASMARVVSGLVQVANQL